MTGLSRRGVSILYRAVRTGTEARGGSSLNRGRPYRERSGFYPGDELAVNVFPDGGGAAGDAFYLGGGVDALPRSAVLDGHSNSPHMTSTSLRRRMTTPTK